jgi:hypothetical protein
MVGFGAQSGLAVNAPIILLAESDYQYGTGSLRLRIEHIDTIDPITYDGERWYRVRGVQVSSDGVELRVRRPGSYLESARLTTTPSRPRSTATW